MPMFIKHEYLGGGVSIRDRRMLLGLGLLSIVDPLKALDLGQDLFRTLGSEISSGQEKWRPIFTVQVFYLDGAELDWLDILGGAEGEFLGSGGSKGSCARYW